MRWSLESQQKILEHEAHDPTITHEETNQYTHS